MKTTEAKLAHFAVQERRRHDERAVDAEVEAAVRRGDERSGRSVRSETDSIDDP